MKNESFSIVSGRTVMRIRDRFCETPQELLGSRLFREVLERCVLELSRKNSPWVLSTWTKRAILSGTGPKSVLL